MSDLHLEFPENREYFRRNPIEPLGDVLLLAGDIICDSYREEAQDFFADIESKFKFILSTMGNHEFYSGSADYAYPDYEKYFSENHVMLNNKSVIYGGVRFIASVLWSKVDSLHYIEVGRRLNDYHLITKIENGEERPLIIEDTNYYHDISKKFIINELEKEFNGKTVLVTHHLPSINCIIPKWRNHNLVSAFATNLEDIISKYNIESWIFGHQHEQFSEVFGNTKMLSNPLGYSREENFHLFESEKYFEIDI